MEGKAEREGGAARTTHLHRRAVRFFDAGLGQNSHPAETPVCVTKVLNRNAPQLGHTWRSFGLLGLGRQDQRPVAEGGRPRSGTRRDCREGLSDAYRTLELVTALADFLLEVRRQRRMGRQPTIDLP